MCFCGCGLFLGFFICVVAVLGGVVVFAGWFVADCGFVYLLVLGVGVVDVWVSLMLSYLAVLDGLICLLWTLL